VLLHAPRKITNTCARNTGFDQPLALPASAPAASDEGSCCPPAPSSPGSHQPALIWLAGELPVSGGDTLPLTATHNTVRLAFDVAEAQYARLLRPTPSFPHTHFAAATDGVRLEAFGRALSYAVSSLKQGSKQSSEPAAAAATAPIVCLDVGCGAGGLSLLALQAGVDFVVGAELYEPLALCARRTLAAAAPSAINTGATSPVSTSTRPITACVLLADAATLERGDAVPAGGFDLIVADVFDPLMVGNQGLQLLETVQSKLLAPGGRVLPVSSTMWVVGVQLLSEAAGPGASADWRSRSSGGGGAAGGGWDFSALDRYRWQPKPETVQLSDVPHTRLTDPVKLFEFQFEDTTTAEAADVNGGRSTGTLPPLSVAQQAASRRFPLRSTAQLTAVQSGVLNAVAVWYELDLGCGIQVTTAPASYLCSPTSSSSAAVRSAQGQGLSYLPAWVHVEAGTEVELAAERQAGRVVFAVGDVSPPPSASSPSTAAGAGAATITPAPRAPWFAEGVGIADPAVWSVKRCEALVGEALMRAPAMRLPPLWCDLQLLQVRSGSGGELRGACCSALLVFCCTLPRARHSRNNLPPKTHTHLQTSPQLHCGSLGLDAALLGSITQELSMREEAAVMAAAGSGERGGVAVSAAACVEALGLGPPISWH